MRLPRLAFLRADALCALACIALIGCSRPLSKPPAHGVTLVVQSEGETNATGLIKEIVSRRVERFGAQAFVETIATNQVRVSASVTDEQEIAALTNLLAARGFMEFRLVHPESERLIFEGKQSSEADYEVLNEIRSRRMKIRDTAGGPNRISETNLTVAVPCLVRKSAEFSGAHVNRAMVQNDAVSGRPHVLITFDKEGAEAFATVTRNNVGRQLAIVIDGKVISVPRIDEPITGGSAVIGGSFSPSDAMAMATLLENPGPFPLTVRVERTY